MIYYLIKHFLDEFMVSVATFKSSLIHLEVIYEFFSPTESKNADRAGHALGCSCLGNDKSL